MEGDVYDSAVATVVASFPVSVQRCAKSKSHDVEVLLWLLSTVGCQGIRSARSVMHGLVRTETRPELVWTNARSLGWIYDGVSRVSRISGGLGCIKLILRET